MSSPIRTVALLVMLVCSMVAVVLVARAIDRTEERANASFELDRFGNPWNPDYRRTNERISHLERARTWLIWGGVLPLDIALLASSIFDLVRHRRRSVALGTLLFAVIAAALLLLTALASVMPSGGVIGARGSPNHHDFG